MYANRMHFLARFACFARPVASFFSILTESFTGKVKRGAMKIVRAKILGFCAGVRRAVLAAEKALEEHDGSEVFSLGPLDRKSTRLNSSHT